jgi:hypothetical protein
MDTHSRGHCHNHLISSDGRDVIANNRLGEIHPLKTAVGVHHLDPAGVGGKELNHGCFL